MHDKRKRRRAPQPTIETNPLAAAIAAVAAEETDPLWRAWLEKLAADGLDEQKPRKRKGVIHVRNQG